MALFLVCVLLMHSTIVYSLDKETINKGTKTDLVLSPSKTIITFLACLKRCSKEKKYYSIPDEIKVKIISYIPSLIYSSHLLKKALLFVESRALSHYCDSLSYAVMKDYLTLYENNDDKRKIIESEINYRDNFPETNEFISPLSAKEMPAFKNSRKKHRSCQII